MIKQEREKLRESLAKDDCWRETYTHPKTVFALLNYMDLLERQLTPEQLEFLRGKV
jgi:hypothetical protein